MKPEMRIENENRKPCKTAASETKGRRLFPIIMKPMLIAFVAILMDFLISPFIAQAILFLTNYSANIPSGEKDVGVGVVFMMTTFLIMIVSFPVWLILAYRAISRLISKE